MTTPRRRAPVTTSPIPSSIQNGPTRRRPGWPSSRGTVSMAVTVACPDRRAPVGSGRARVAVVSLRLPWRSRLERSHDGWVRVPDGRAPGGRLPAHGHPPRRSRGHLRSRLSPGAAERGGDRPPLQLPLRSRPQGPLLPGQSPRAGHRPARLPPLLARRDHPQVPRRRGLLLEHRSADDRGRRRRVDHRGDAVPDLEQRPRPGP